MNSFNLNDDEIKRIMMVIERDFKLRQKEAKRLEEIEKTIQREHERVEYLAGSKEFNISRCIRCFKPFKILFNPKEICSQCQLYVCHNCAKYQSIYKNWICILCEQIKDWQHFTGTWFYQQIGTKYKRCGSAKIIRDLYKHEKEYSQIDDDLGYDTLRKSLSTDSVHSYIVHDQDLRKELNEYSKRLNFLIDNLHTNLSGGDQNKVNLKDHLQQIISEISRAKMALARPLRRTNKQFTLYENDLQNLILQKTEEILQMNFDDFQKNDTIINFDQKLAQLIVNQYLKQSKYSRQITGEFSTNNSNVLSKNFRSTTENLRRMDFTRTPAVDEEDIEEDENNHHSLINSELQSMKISNDWKLNCTLIESHIPSNEDKKYSTWF